MCESLQWKETIARFRLLPRMRLKCPAILHPSEAVPVGLAIVAFDSPPKITGFLHLIKFVTMDPVSALSLAASVVSVIQVSREVVGICSDLVKTGSVSKYEATEGAAENLGSY